MDHFYLLNDLMIGNALGAVKNDHLSAPFKAIFLKNMLYDLIIFVGIRPPVSYTHLDVYKRQPKYHR